MERPVKQVLLIAANDWTEGLVEEAVNEIRDGRILAYDYQLVPVTSLTEAAELIERASFDLVLLDPYVPECRPMEAFLELRAALKDSPIVLLCGKEDEPLATRALREGAQDYLIIDEIDCLPFARSLRNAMDRFSANLASSPEPFRDAITGLYNKPGFFLLAEFMLKQARIEYAASALLIMEFVSGNQRREHDGEHQILRLLDLSDAIRSTLGEGEIAGRLGDNQFAAAATGVNIEALERLRNALAVSMPEILVGYASMRAAETNRPSSGRGAIQAGLPASIHDLINAATTGLCENYSKELIPAH